MNRRQFLSSTAAGILAAPALLRQASAQESPFRVKYYPVAAGMGSRDVDARARRHDLVQRPAQRHAGTARSARRLVQAGRSRQGRRAPRRHHRPRRRALGDRGRAERDRARRPRRSQGHAVPPARKGGLRQPQHRRVRQERHLLVHRPVRHLWPARPEVGRHDRVQGAARPRHLRHRRSRRRATSGTPRSPAITSPGSIPRPATRPWSNRRRPTRARAGCGRIPRAGSGSANGTAATSRCTIPPTAPGRPGSCRAAVPRTYAVYVDDKDKVWLTDFGANAIVRFDPVTEKFNVFPSDKSGANVRQLDGRPGETWGGESGTDRLVVIQTAAPA